MVSPDQSAIPERGFKQHPADGWASTVPHEPAVNEKVRPQVGDPCGRCGHKMPPGVEVYASGHRSVDDTIVWICYRHVKGQHKVTIK